MKAARRQPVATSVATSDDYLAFETGAETRHEYVGGRIYAMTRASREHNQVALNLYSALRPRLRGGPCRLYALEMKVRVDAADAFYYPDVVATCDPADSHPLIIHRPALIAEVLSPSTERLDRTEKLPNYQTIPSLRTILLVSQTEPVVEVHRRTETGWAATVLAGEGTIAIDWLGVAVRMGEVYD